MDSANASVADDNSDFITRTNDVTVDDDNDVATMSNKTFLKAWLYWKSFSKRLPEY